MNKHLSFIFEKLFFKPFNKDLYKDRVLLQQGIYILQSVIPITDYKFNDNGRELLFSGKLFMDIYDDNDNLPKYHETAYSDMTKVAQIINNPTESSYTQEQWLEYLINNIEVFQELFWQRGV